MKCLFISLFCFGTLALSAQTDGANGNWGDKFVFKKATPEADWMIRLGDIDNLGFGWQDNYDPFSGKMSNSHEWPMEKRDSTEAPGFDMVMIGTSYKDPGKAQDGYCGARDYLLNNFGKTTFEFKVPMKGVDTSKIKNACLQIFVDDFQARAFGSKFEFYLNGKRYAPAERMLNALNQTGPIGKLLTITIAPDRIKDFKKDTVSFLFDDRTTGLGDGFAVDFIKVLINPATMKTGSVNGTVFNLAGKPAANATVSCGNLSVKTQPNGTFKMTGVPAGLAVLTVILADKKEQDFTVDVEGGADNKAELRFE